MVIKKIGLLVLATTLFLVGCSNEEVEERKQARVNYEILDTYEYDRVKVVVEEELTAAELATETLREKVGLTTGGVLKYSQVGIAEGLGIFVETAISDGSVIPTKSGFSDAEIEAINSSTDKSWEELLVENFSTLEDGRKKSLSSLNENIDKESELTAEIAKAAEEQKARIAKQEKDLEEQQKQEAILEDTEEEDAYVDTAE